MALRGSLEVFGLADILQLINFQRKSGVLTVEGEKDEVKVFFMEGNIVRAISQRRQEDSRLGKVLLKRGALKDEDLQIALEEQRRTGKALGGILLGKGVVDEEHIKEVLTSQITETVLQLFSWEKGTYEFIPQAITLDSAGDKEVPVILDTQQLLMEGLRILDEWSVLERRLALDTILTTTSGAVADLSKEEQEMLSLVDGENDLSTIIDISGKDGFAVAKILFSLMDKGTVQVKEVASVIEEPSREVKIPEISDSVLYKVAAKAAIAISIMLSLSLAFLSGDDTIKKFRASKAVEDLRLKIEAYKFEHGDYPVTLDAVSRQLDPWKRPYIYKHGEQTFAVVSTGADGKEGTEDDVF
jgi:Domain of unknown function (DUF4388)/Type II secretion system (T2SS), protein G